MFREQGSSSHSNQNECNGAARNAIVNALCGKHVVSQTRLLFMGVVPTPLGDLPKPCRVVAAPTLPNPKPLSNPIPIGSC